MSVQAVRKSCHWFKNGRTSVFDEERAGQSVSALTDQLCQIDVAMQENCNVHLSWHVACDYLTFGQMKIALHDCMFHSDEEVQEMMTEWVNYIGGEIWFHTVYNLIPWWNECVNRLSNYIENWSISSTFF